MKQIELIEQIEAYLNNTLPPEQLQAWEQRLADDGALRYEVELHRRLQQDFNAGRLHLRSNLQQVMQESLPKAETPTAGISIRRGLWLGLLCLVLISAFGVWYWQAPAPVAPKAPSAETPLPPATKSPVAAPVEQPDTPKTLRPMALRDPAHFTPNPGMEAFVHSGMRSESIEIKMNRPANGVRFMPDKKGAVGLRFTGSVNQPDDQAPGSFVLSFFDNHNASKSLLELPIPMQHTTDASLKFDLQPRLYFPPGLYYFTVEEAGKGEILYAGKFLIGT